MNDRINKEANAAPSLADSIEARIKQLIEANVSIFGTNISELLESQRKRTSQLTQLNKEIIAANNRLGEELSKYVTPTEVKAECGGACPGCAQPDPNADNDEDSDIKVELKVTGTGPIPPELTAMLDDLTEMLQSVGRRK